MLNALFMVGSAAFTLLPELSVTGVFAATGVLTAVIGLWMLGASPAMRPAFRARFAMSG